jgi:hypothetical protein
MATIAAIFHWSPDVLGRMSLAELMLWHGKAVALHNAMNRTE